MIRTNHALACVISLLTLGYCQISLAVESRVYASVRVSAQLEDAGDEYQAELVDDSSRLGFYGKHHFNNSFTAIGHYEIGVKTDEARFGGGDTNRLSYAGIENENAGIYLGTQWSPYYQIVGQVTDQFNSLGAKQVHSVGRLSNLITFSGSYGNSRVEVGFVIEDNNKDQQTGFVLDPVTGEIVQQTTPGFDDDEFIDRLQLAASFRTGDIAVGVGLDRISESITGTEEGDVFGLSAVYDNNSTTTIAISFHNQDKELLSNDWEGDKSLRQIDIYGGYTDQNGNLYHAGFGQSDDTHRTAETLTLGYQRQWSDQIRIWIEAELTDPNSNSLEKITTFSSGLRFDWE